MTLPAELRNEIFELAYVQRNAYTGARKTISMSSLLLGRKRILNNMIVSKQYQAEASALFWGGNIFQIEQSGGEERRATETDEERFVTKGKDLLFKSIAYGNKLQVKVVAINLIRWFEDGPSETEVDSFRTKGVSEKFYAVLLPPARYIPLIKNIVFRIPVATSLLQGNELKTTIQSQATNLGAQSWLRAISRFDVLGFMKMEKVTFRLVATKFKKKQETAVRKYVLDSNINSMETKVVFEEDIASD